MLKSDHDLPPPAYIWLMTTLSDGVVTVNAAELVELAVAVDTFTGPVVAPSGTVALI